MLATSLLFLLVFFTLYIIFWHRHFITIVKSESMAPTLSRGDILISVIPSHINVGEIVIGLVKHRNMLLCHRVISITYGENGTRFMTKGDANAEDDRWLFKHEKLSGFPKEDILGKVYARIPIVGRPIMSVQETLMGKALLACAWLSLVWVSVIP